MYLKRRRGARGRPNGELFEVVREGTDYSISAALLVACFVGLLVFVFLEVPFLGVVPVMRMVILALAHALLICLRLRVIRVVILE